MTTIPPGDIAPIRRRVVAYVIDALIAGVLPVVGVVVMVTVMVSALQSRDAAAGALASVAVAAAVFGLLILGWFVVYTIMQTGKGSIGMRAQRIRLASAADLAPLSFWRALLRNIVFSVTGSFVVGMFSPLFDGTGHYQGWHDKVAGAVMLDAAAVHPIAPASSAPVAPALPNPLSTGGYTGQPTPPAPPAPFAFPEPVRDAPPLPDGFPDETVVGPRPASSAAPVIPAAPSAPTAPAAPAAPAGASDQTVAAPPVRADLPGDPLISFVPGVTQPGPAPAAAPAAPAAPAVPAAPPVPAPAAPAPVQPAAEPQAAPPAPGYEHDDDLESTRISVPGHRLVFTWDDGQRASVSSRTVFGRNPEQEPGVVVVAVRDETLSLSKTHFEAGSEPTGGWVMDRHSTNGLTIVRDGTRIACPAGQRVPVRLGDALEIGDRIVTIGGFA